MAAIGNWICSEKFEYTEAARRISEKHKTEEAKMTFVKTVDKENRCVKYRHVKTGYKPKEGETLHYGRI